MFETRVTCDICSKETRGFGDSSGDIAKNNWTVAVDSIWLNGSESDATRELIKDRELHYDACIDCAREVAQSIRVAVARMKGNVQRAS